MKKVEYIARYGENAYKEHVRKQREYNKQYYATNKQEIAEYNRQYYKDNKEYFAEHKKQYYATNKQEIAEHKKQYYATNKQEIAERNRQYYATNKQEIAEHKKQYYATNKEYFAEHKKQYKNETKVGRAAMLIGAYRQKDKKYNRGDCTLTHQWFIDNIFGSSCFYCGCSDWHQLGADRIDNSLPHTPDNVVPCCCNCNHERGTMDFKLFVEKKIRSKC